MRTAILPAKVSDWPMPWRELYEERAAMMEYQANMMRALAEHMAEADVRWVFQQEQ